MIYKFCFRCLHLSARAVFAVVLILGFQLAAQASVSLSATRLIISEGQNEATVRILNEGGQPVLIQSWIDRGDSNAPPEHVQVPFVITSSTFRLEPQTSQLLRILFTGEVAQLPADKESVFWLNVQEIPPNAVSDSDGNYIQLAFRTRIKLFYRPRQLPDQADHFPEQLKFSVTQQNNAYVLNIHNPTPVHITLISIHIGKNKQPPLVLLAPRDGMIAPEETLRISLDDLHEEPGKDMHVFYTFIDDYGTAIERQQPLP